MPIYSTVATDETVGTTIDTFDAINTRNGNLTLRQATDHINALIFSGARANNTTATAVMGRLRFTSADLGVTNEDFAVGAVSGGGTATTNPGLMHNVDYIPVDWGPSPGGSGGDIGGSIINLAFSQMGIEPADNWSVAVGVQHRANTPPPPEWYNAGFATGVLPLQGSRSSLGAGVSAVTRTTLVSTTIPARYTQLVSLRTLFAPDPVPTTTEEVAGFVELTGTIADITPNEYPIPTLDASLGTLTINSFGLDVLNVPIYLIKAGNSVDTFEPFLTLTTAVTAAHAFGYSVGLRY